MNILLVCDFLSEDIQGGSDRIVYEHSKQLKGRGHSVKIIASGDIKYSQRDNFSKDIDVFRYRVSRNQSLRLFQTLSNSRKFFEKLSSQTHFDVINFHQPLSAFTILCSKKTKRMFKVYTFHSPWHREYEIRHHPKSIFYNINSILRKLIERFCLRRCDRYIVLSEYMKKELINIHNVKKDKISIIPGGVDTEKFKPSYSKVKVREKLSLPVNKFIMLSIRNLTKRTGLIELVIAIRPFLEKNDDLILVIVSDGPQREEIEDLIEKFNLRSKIIVTGFVEEEVLPLYYQASDLFIMPTQQLEGFGLAILEALSSGLPVLATPIGGIPEILSGMDKKFLFEGISMEFLTKGLQRILSKRDMIRTMADETRGYCISRYSWKDIIPKLEKEFIRQR